MRNAVDDRQGAGGDRQCPSRLRQKEAEAFDLAAQPAEAEDEVADTELLPPFGRHACVKRFLAMVDATDTDVGRGRVGRPKLSIGRYNTLVNSHGR